MAMGKMKWKFGDGIRQDSLKLIEYALIVKKIVAQFFYGFPIVYCIFIIMYIVLSLYHLNFFFPFLLGFVLYRSI